MEYRFRFTGQMIPARPGIRMLIRHGSETRDPVVEAWGVFEEVKADDDDTETPTGYREVRPLIVGEAGLTDPSGLLPESVEGPYTPEEDIPEDERALILAKVSR